MVKTVADFVSRVAVLLRCMHQVMEEDESAQYDEVEEYMTELEELMYNSRLAQTDMPLVVLFNQFYRDLYVAKGALADTHETFYALYDKAQEMEEQ
jgi:hypothetical protein